MNISLICFSLSGMEVMDRLAGAFLKKGHRIETAMKSKYLSGSLQKPLKEWCWEQFQKADALIFVGAAGIAVRGIAPFVDSKKTDPAVVVVDELGTYAVSLLSGHLGGANELAESCGKILGARPVITTATDLNGRFAVDVFAKKNGMTILRMSGAKGVSAGLLSGEPVGFYSEFPVKGRLPEGLYPCDRRGCRRDTGERLAVGVAVTVHRDCLPFEDTAVLVPPAVVLGLGCKKGTDGETIRRRVEAAFHKEGLLLESLSLLASIRLKANEEGILAFCQARGIPFVTFLAEELSRVKGEFTPSAFVKKSTGVENVCERSAICGGGAVLIQKKAGAEGVTTALAVKDWSVKF